VKKRVNKLSSEKTVIKDFNFLAKDIGYLDTELKKIEDSSNRLGDEDFKQFVKDLRKFYEKRQELMREETKIENKMGSAVDSERRAVEFVKAILNKMMTAQAFSPSEFAVYLEHDFERFSRILTSQTRYHLSTRNGYVVVTSLIENRMKLLQEIKDTFDRLAFQRVISAGEAAEMRHNLSTLIEKRYPDLLLSLQALDKLFGEFNTHLYNIYNTTAQLDMIKGIDVKPKGFFAKLFGKKEKVQIPLGLSDNDRRRIKALQAMMDRLTNTTLIAIKGRQSRALPELHQIMQEEAEVRSVFKKAFGRGKTVIPRQLPKAA